jgi:methionyl-tRNA synthetase
VVSGIALYFPDTSLLVDKKCMFVANLEPRTIRGLESQGMIAAVSTEDGKFSLLSVTEDIPAGTRAK